MTQQLSNILHPILDHRRSLQAQTPAINPHILRQTHRLQHLRSEHPTITNLHPLIQAIMIPKDFHTGLGVRVVGRFETESMDAHFRKEDFHEADEAAEREAVIRDHALDLVEFCKVCSVDAFVAEDAVDGEVAGWAGVGGKLVEHVG